MAVRLVHLLLTRALTTQLEHCAAVKPCSAVIMYSCSHSQLMMLRLRASARYRFSVVNHDDDLCWNIQTFENTIVIQILKQAF